MQAYLVRRLFESALILLGITLVTFILLYLVLSRSGAADRGPLRDRRDGAEHPRPAWIKRSVFHTILALPDRALAGRHGAQLPAAC